MVSKQKVFETFKDYVQIMAGLAIYATGFTCFMLPYDITSGGVGGISALIYFATGFNASYSYTLINLGLLCVAVFIMGTRYAFRTILASLVVSLVIEYAQVLLTDENGQLIRLVGDEKFMACVVGGLMEGFGLATVFMAGGSTGGTDIIASCINKHRNISLGRILLYLDLIIIASSYLIFHSIETLVVCYVVMIISMTFVDFVINAVQRSVQFIIISSKEEEIAEAVGTEVERGVTVLNGEGWYSKEQRRVLLILAKRYERRNIFRIINRIDPHAFVSISNVEGVFGEGFDTIKK
ncbi:MAG: YitT family protein [Bacteroidaceae bacterium]|nr:YitT family protein [Bacteroidaceae bacterium]